MRPSTSARGEACRVHGSSKGANTTLVGMVVASFLLMVWHVWSYGPSGHTAGADVRPASFLLLLVGEISDVLFGSHGMLAELWDVLPYFLVGILLAGYLRTFKVAVKLQMKLRKHGLLSVFLAAFIGLISPLCACGTLTTAVSLLFAGMPLAPIMALMVTSPLLSPSTYLLTLNDLGPEWTVIRTVAAFLMGVLAGVVTHLLAKRGFRTADVFVEGGIARGDFHDEDYPDERLRCDCKERFGNRVATRTSNKFLIFLAKSSEMLWTVGKYVLVGVAIGTVVERYMPHEWLFVLFGRKDPLNILWVTLGSVPIFLHQISASSIVSHLKDSLDGTVDGGAALAFMIGGPVTAMPTMVLFWTIFKKRVFVLYLSVCIVGTVLVAYAFRALFFVPGVDTGNPLVSGVGALSGGRSAVIQKQSRNVRIVLDPQGKNLVAVYANDAEGHGSVVFDGGTSRFRGGSAPQLGNSVYVCNVARWLEENAGASGDRKILLYATSRAPGADEHVSRSVVERLRGDGFQVAVTNRKDTPELSEEILSRYDQLWVFFDGGPDGQLLEPELERVSRFVEDGKGLLIVAGAPGRGMSADGPANRLSSRFGAVFSAAFDHEEVLRVNPGGEALGRAAEWLGRALKLVNKA